jgi:hypothetical protein
MSFGERFLVHPDLFPARRAGEPWGDRGLTVDLPGGPYRLTGLSAAQEQGAREAFGAFCAPENGGGGVEVRFFAAAPGDFRPVDTRGWEYELDVDHGPRAVRLAGLGLLARIDWTEAGCAGAVWSSEEGERFPGICENFVRVLLAYRLLELGGVLLHSAGVVDRGRAVLFLGRSGAGKTTAAGISLASGREVLSDDLNAVLPGGREGARGAPSVARLPFAGDLRRAEAGAGAFPLRAVLRLEKSAAAALAPLSPALVAATLLACSPYVNADPHRREALLEVLERLARAIPARRLGFSLAGDFWSILDTELP